MDKRERYLRLHQWRRGRHDADRKRGEERLAANDHHLHSDGHRRGADLWRRRRKRLDSDMHRYGGRFRRFRHHATHHLPRRLHDKRPEGTNHRSLRERL